MHPKSLALTFDDGPDAGMMPAVMELLNRYDAKATFFVLGSKINEQTAPVLRSAAEQGFEIGNHSENHLHMPSLMPEQMLWEVEQVQRKVEQETGRRPSLFRPPYLDVSGQMLSLIPMPFIFGFSNRDWDCGCTVEQRISQALKDSRDGAVLLMHCFEGNEPTLEALEYLLPELKRRGYRITTVSDLFRDKGIPLERGKIYEQAAYEEERK